MAEYQTFSFEDSFTAKTQERLDPSLIVLGERDPEILIILRILSGTLKITHNYSDTEMKSRINYFVTNSRSFGKKWLDKFPILVGDDITSEDLALYITTTKNINKAFYKNILSEISHFIYQTNKGSHTSAFIYVYRFLEKISYAFPLIYASRSNDYLNSYNQLKTMMSGGNNKSELGFFKTFIKNLYKDNPISETSIDISIAVAEEDVQTLLFKSMKNVCDDDIFHEDTTEPRKLSINYCEMMSFIITIRNRFFHNLNSGKNIESSKIVDSDLFFSLINRSSMEWISMVFLEIFSHNISEFQKMLPNND